MVAVEGSSHTELKLMCTLAASAIAILHGSVRTRLVSIEIARLKAFRTNDLTSSTASSQSRDYGHPPLC